MSELRDRIEQIIDDKTWAMAPDGFIAGTEEAAQAIIDDLGLTPTANSRRNQMIQYETRWMERTE